jgi:hypothetical protein
VKFAAIIMLLGSPICAKRGFVSCFTSSNSTGVTGAHAAVKSAAKFAHEQREEALRRGRGRGLRVARRAALAAEEPSSSVSSRFGSTLTKPSPGSGLRRTPRGSPGKRQRGLQIGRLGALQCIELHDDLAAQQSGQRARDALREIPAEIFEHRQLRAADAPRRQVERHDRVGRVFSSSADTSSSEIAARAESPPAPGSSGAVDLRPGLRPSLHHEAGEQQVVDRRTAFLLLHGTHFGERFLAQLFLALARHQRSGSRDCS